MSNNADENQKFGEKVNTKQFFMYTVFMRISTQPRISAHPRGRKS